MSDDPNAIAAPPAFVDGIAEANRDYVKNKGWDSADKAVQSYVELEKFVGADKAGRGLVIPGEKATPEEIAAFRSKAYGIDGGIPEAPDAYGLAVPDGFPDPDAAKTAGQLFHKFNVPKAMGEGLFSAVVAAEAAREAEADRVFKAEAASLETEWGADHDKNKEIAKRGAARAGFSDDLIDKLYESKVAGFPEIMKAMHKLGTLLGEGKFIDGDVAGGDTLDSLMAKRTALTKDAAWAQRFHANEASARTEWSELERKIAAARARA